MDFSLSDEQEQMKETVREFLEEEGGIELARRQLDGEDGVVDEVWDQLTETEYTALTVPFDYGGLGDGMLYLALFLEEAGRFALPGPIAETLGFAVPLIDELGSVEQKETYFPAIADGDQRFSIALYEDNNEELPNGIQLSAEETDDGYSLSGTKSLVPYAEDVDSIVVAARTQEATGYRGITLFIVDPSEAAVTELEGLDWTRPVYELEFDEVTVDESAQLGPLNGGGGALERGIDRLNVSISAMLIGAADRAVDLSVEHGNEREQFGQPVGRFQAVKHRTVDMWMDMQAGRSLMYYAAWAVANNAPDAPRAVSAAKSFTTEQCTDIFGNDILNHGGMGFTWDHDGHIYLKQAKAWENYLGTPEAHRERIADSRL